MKKTKRIFALIALLVITTMLFAACGGKNNVEASPEEQVSSYVKKNKESVEKAVSETTDDEDSVKCEMLSEGTSIIYKYTYKTEQDAESKKETIIADFKAIEKEMPELLEKIKKECPTAQLIEYRYYNADGSEIFIKKFEMPSQTK